MVATGGRYKDKLLHLYCSFDFNANDRDSGLPHTVIVPVSRLGRFVFVKVDFNI